MTEEPVSVVGYIRVSTKEQAAEGVSLDAQRAKIDAYVTYKGYNLVELIADEGVSAGKPLNEREGGARLLAMTDAKQVSGVIACKLDRLFRNALDCLEVTYAWDAEDVTMHLLDINLDTSTPYGRFFMTSIVAFAELERAMIRERIRVGMAQVKAEGYQLGAAPYGAEHLDKESLGEEALDENGRVMLKQNPEQVEVIEKIKELRYSGMTYQAIADKLNQDDIQTQKGKSWHRSVVYNIIKRNPH